MVSLWVDSVNNQNRKKNMKVLQILTLLITVQFALAQDRPVPVRHSGGVPIFVAPPEKNSPVKKQEQIVTIATANALRLQADAQFPVRNVVYVTQSVPTGPIAWEAPGRQEATWYVPPAQDPPMTQNTTVSSQSGVAYMQPDYSTVSTYYSYPSYGYRYSYRYPYRGSYSYSYSYPYSYSYVGYRAGFSWSSGGHNHSHHRGHRHRR